MISLILSTTMVSMFVAMFTLVSIAKSLQQIASAVAHG